MKILVSASIAVLSTAVIAVVWDAEMTGGVDHLAQKPQPPDTTIVGVPPPETFGVVETLVDVGVSVIVEEVLEEVVDVTDTTIYSAIDDDLLEAALLTAEDLNAAPGLDYLGDGWQPGHVGLQIEVSGDDHTAGEGLCPGGDNFVLPASQVGFDLIGGDGVFVFESIMSFEHPESAESWVAAYESCPEEWKEEGDPDEYITVEPVEIADFGEDSTAFRLLYEHTTSVDTEHDEAIAFVRVGPTVLVAVRLENYADAYDPAAPYDPSLLNDLTAAAVAKVEATLD